MSDPAIDAAQRADESFVTPVPDMADLDHMAAAAREALKPIRELHVPQVVESLDDECWTECRECLGAVWPCETAKLIYTSEELDTETA